MESKAICELDAGISKIIKNGRTNTIEGRTKQIIEIVNESRSGRIEVLTAFIVSAAIDIKNHVKIIKSNFPEYRPLLAKFLWTTRPKSQPKSQQKSQVLFNKVSVL